MLFHYVNPVSISSTYQIVYYQAKQTLGRFAQNISGHVLIMEVKKNKINIFLSFFVIDFLHVINDYKKLCNMQTFKLCFNKVFFFIYTRYCLSYVAIFKRGKR